MGREYNNSIALRGGNENANFYLSYGNVHNDGVLPGKTDVYNRNTVAMRGQLKSNKFVASASLNYINKEGHTVFSNSSDAAGSSTFSNIIQIGRDIPITDFKDYNNKFFNVDNYFTPYAAENRIITAYSPRNGRYGRRKNQFRRELVYTWVIGVRINIQLFLAGEYGNCK